MDLKKNLNKKTYIKLTIFLILSIFSLKIVNSTNSTTQNIPEIINIQNDFVNIQAKLDKINYKIIIDGITYNLVDPKIKLETEEVAGYLKMNTSEIVFSLLYVSSKIFKKKFSRCFIRWINVWINSRIFIY